jgi:hypothetical protein
MTEQLLVESHLRWCRDCNLRVQDMRLIGTALKAGTALRVGTGTAPDRNRDDESVSAINEAVLLRVRAEREQSFGFRLREMVTDMRFMLPAAGATAAVAICLSVAAGVLQASTANQPQSLASLLPILEPGTEHNPVRPANNGISIPRLHADDAKRAGGTLDHIPEEDVIYTIRTVVNRDGRVSNLEVLLADSNPVPAGTANAILDRAVMDAVQQSRFAPAYTPLGRAVAVEMVWVIAKTTAVAPLPAAFTPAVVAKRRPKDVPKPPVDEETAPIIDAPGGRRSATEAQLTTA